MIYAQHDCENCVFLGSYMGHDLYLHHARPVTFVCRYGDDGPDYTSSPPDGYFATTQGIFAKAAALAARRGLLLKDAE